MDEPFYYLSAEDVVPRDAAYIIVGGSVRVVEPRIFKDYLNLRRVELHEGVEEIGRSAFQNCPNLERVDCPTSLRTIGDYAFYCCEMLSEVVLREGLRQIGAWAFSACDLRRIAVPSSVVEISDGAFAGCRQLSEVILREGLRRIGASAFYSCFDLRRIAVPSSVAEIGQKAFARCSNLEAATLAEGMAMLARKAFLRCPRLERIAISSTAVVVEAGEDGDGRAAAVTGEIGRHPANDSPRLILTSPQLGSMRPEELRSLTDAINQIAAATRGVGPLDLADGDVSGRIRDCFVDHVSTWYRWYKGEAAAILELRLWKIEPDRAARGEETAGADAPTRDDYRRTCGAVPIVGLVLSSLAGPHRRADQSENKASIQP